MAQIYGLSAADYARVLACFRLLDQDQPALEGEPRSFATRDATLLEFFKVVGEKPPSDIVKFYAEAGADITALTGAVRGLEARVEAAKAVGAVGYVLSRKRAADEEADTSEVE